jgi:hypothetical protein
VLIPTILTARASETDLSDFVSLEVTALAYDTCGRERKEYRLQAHVSLRQKKSRHAPGYRDSKQ